MNCPNFFIVGAPKCGTTSLCHYLSRHPDIFIPEQKELNYFASDLDMPRFYKVFSEYLQPFTATSKTVCGEATTWYLYSRTAAQEIYDCNPSAKIIVALRQPTDMVYSLFRHRRYRRMEDAASLAQVLDREKAYTSKLNGRTKTTMIYLQAAKYHEQVERYITTFGAGSVHVVLFDDLKDQPEQVYRRMLQFLGVPDDHRPSFNVVNRTGRIRSERLQQWLDHLPDLVRTVSRTVPQGARRKAYWALRRMNVSYAPPPPLDPELRRRLDDELRSDVERLGALIGRDLTHWTAA